MGQGNLWDIRELPVLETPNGDVQCLIEISNLKVCYSNGSKQYAALNLGLLEKLFSMVSFSLSVTATAKIQTSFESYNIKGI